MITDITVNEKELLDLELELVDIEYKTPYSVEFKFKNKDYTGDEFISLIAGMKNLVIIELTNTIHEMYKGANQSIIYIYDEIAQSLKFNDYIDKEDIWFKYAANLSGEKPEHINVLTELISNLEKEIVKYLKPADEQDTSAESKKEKQMETFFNATYKLNNLISNSAYNYMYSKDGYALLSLIVVAQTKGVVSRNTLSSLIDNMESILNGRVNKVLEDVEYFVNVITYGSAANSDGIAEHKVKFIIRIPEERKSTIDNSWHETIAFFLKQAVDNTNDQIAVDKNTVSEVPEDFYNPINDNSINDSSKTDTQNGVTNETHDENSSMVNKPLEEECLKIEQRLTTEKNTFAFVIKHSLKEIQDAQVISDRIAYLLNQKLTYSLPDVNLHIEPIVTWFEAPLIVDDNYSGVVHIKLNIVDDSDGDYSYGNYPKIEMVNGINELKLSIHFFPLQTLKLLINENELIDILKSKHQTTNNGVAGNMRGYQQPMPAHEETKTNKKENNMEDKELYVASAAATNEDGSCDLILSFEDSFEYSDDIFTKLNSIIDHYTDSKYPPSSLYFPTYKVHADKVILNTAIGHDKHLSSTVTITFSLKYNHTTIGSTPDVRLAIGVRDGLIQFFNVTDQESNLENQPVLEIPEDVLLKESNDTGVDKTNTVDNDFNQKLRELKDELDAKTAQINRDIENFNRNHRGFPSPVPTPSMHQQPQYGQRFNHPYPTQQPVNPYPVQQPVYGQGFNHLSYMQQPIGIHNQNGFGANTFQGQQIMPGQQPMPGYNNQPRSRVYAPENHPVMQPKESVSNMSNTNDSFDFAFRKIDDASIGGSLVLQLTYSYLEQGTLNQRKLFNEYGIEYGLRELIKNKLGDFNNVNLNIKQSHTLDKSIFYIHLDSIDSNKVDSFVYKEFSAFDVIGLVPKDKKNVKYFTINIKEIEKIFQLNIVHTYINKIAALNKRSTDDIKVPGSVGINLGNNMYDTLNLVKYDNVVFGTSLNPVTMNEVRPSNDAEMSGTSLDNDVFKTANSSVTDISKLSLFKIDANSDEKRLSLLLDLDPDENASKMDYFNTDMYSIANDIKTLICNKVKGTFINDVSASVIAESPHPKILISLRTTQGNLVHKRYDNVDVVGIITANNNNHYFAVTKDELTRVVLDNINGADAIIADYHANINLPSRSSIKISRFNTDIINFTTLKDPDHGASVQVKVANNIHKHY